MFTLFDGLGHVTLKPLTYTRPVADLRVGIYTVKEKWELFLEESCNVRTKDYLTDRFRGFDGPESIGIAATVLPDPALVKAIKELEANQLLVKDGMVLAINSLPESTVDFDAYLEGFEMIEYDGEVSVLRKPADLFLLNQQEIECDLNWIKSSTEFTVIDQSNTVIGDQIYIEEGASVKGCSLNSESGPIYIASGAEVMEGSMIRGPFAALPGSVCKMGYKIYGATTLGPCCKVGGELNNVVFQGYSNKGHDGFLGNSVIGMWCNLGADTNTSNLKNNYGSVRAWNYSEEAQTDTGLLFHGLIMGDHSKCGINTMFNTGTVVGVSTNVFGGEFPPKFIPSFSWGGNGGMTVYDLDKSFETADRVMSRRDIELTESEKLILKRVFEDSKKYRDRS